MRSEVDGLETVIAVGATDIDDKDITTADTGVIILIIL